MLAYPCSPAPLPVRFQVFALCRPIWNGSRPLAACFVGVLCANLVVVVVSVVLDTDTDSVAEHVVTVSVM